MRKVTKRLLVAMSLLAMFVAGALAIQAPQIEDAVPGMAMFASGDLSPPEALPTFSSTNIEEVPGDEKYITTVDLPTVTVTPLAAETVCTATTTKHDIYDANAMTTTSAGTIRQDAPEVVRTIGDKDGSETTNLTILTDNEVGDNDEHALGGHRLSKARQ